MTRRDDLCKRDPTSPELPKLNYDIQNRIYAHKRQKFRDCVETLDQKTYVTKLWITIKGIHGRVKRKAENEAITFNGITFSLSKQLATKFNTSKLGRHFFNYLISNKGDKEEIIGDGTDIHHISSEESNQEI